MPMTMRQFFDDPAARIRAAADFAGIDLKENAVAAIVREKVHSRHAKNQGSAYSPQQHRADAERIAGQYRSDIDRALGWAQQLFDRLPVQSFPGED